MNYFLLYFLDEIKSIIKKIDIIIPSLFSSIIPILVFIYGFKKLDLVDYSKTLLSGFLFTELLSISLSAVVFLTIELSISGIQYYFSLPFSTKTIIILKFLSSYIVSFFIGVISFNIANTFLFKIFDIRILYIFILLILQTILLSSFSCILISLVKDFTRLGLILSLSNTILVYFSPVYFPINIFPKFIKNIMIFNPLYFPILFLRGLLENKFYLNFLLIIIFLASIYQIISYFILYKKIIKNL